ncbi:hypothetical protein DL96DRAFT_1743812 [Flagelloscypha sp. PMI_526]|nr:hypothetical protein DL96DRAFT_1743812 [Flagelloscypha sp. PMI_526]
MHAPSIPPDVLRLLFEAATAMGASIGFSLSLVSREVNLWITPILYDSIHLELPEPTTTYNRGQKLLRTITEVQPSRASSIRQLAFSGNIISHEDTIQTFIATLGSLSSIALIPTEPAPRIFIEIALPSSIQRVTWEAWGLKVKVKNLSQLHSLTHLHILTLSDTKSEQAVLSLLVFLSYYQLPCLKNIALTFPTLKLRDPGTESLAPIFPFIPFSGVLEDLFAKTPTLELCVVSFSAPPGLEGPIQFPQQGIDMIRGDFLDKLVVVGDEDFVGADEDFLILKGGFKASDWQDMRCWEKAQAHLNARNARRA